MTAFLVDGPDDSAATLLLAHGAGAPMDSVAMRTAAQTLAMTGLRVLRFEFAYMASRRASGRRKPPPRADMLMAEYLAAVAAIDSRGILVVGGKSMGGRVASMVADELYARRRVAGLLCLGYPFHPSGRPDDTRTTHLISLSTPTLICQGTRDPFGTREEVVRYPLSPSIEILWLEDGDHDFKPRRATSGLSAPDHWRSVAEGVRAWVDRLSAAG
jgi:predicted alpha/beta-hydrolase family hydrolase